MSGRMKQCSNPRCTTKSGRRRRFSVANTHCPTCHSPAQAMGRGSSKGGGKGGSSKGIRVGGGSLGRRTKIGKRRRASKVMVKWGGFMKEEDWLKAAPRKSPPRKRV
jgi:hypothetical protein